MRRVTQLICDLAIILLLITDVIASQNWNNAFLSM